jgi:hypothetical protein
MSLDRVPRPIAQIESTGSSLLRAWREEADRLDVAAYAAIAATPTPTMDAGLRRLSRAADKSRLWLGCATLLAVVGGERGRAAAVNGLASIALIQPSSTSCSSRSAIGAGRTDTRTRCRWPVR